MKNNYLSIFQLLGMTISMIIISVWAFESGGMMPYFILFVGLLFFPFAIVAIFSLLNIQKYKKTIQVGIWIGTALLVLTSYSLPIFFELGGLVIAFICSLIAIYLWMIRKEIERQLSLFNFLGTLVVTVVLFVLILAWLV